MCLVKEYDSELIDVKEAVRIAKLIVDSNREMILDREVAEKIMKNLKSLDEIKEELDK